MPTIADLSSGDPNERLHHCYTQRQRAQEAYHVQRCYLGRLAQQMGIARETLNKLEFQFNTLARLQENIDFWTDQADASANTLLFSPN